MKFFVNQMSKRHGSKILFCLLLLVGISSSEDNCPKKCSCPVTALPRVSCHREGVPLTTIPQNDEIPYATKSLDVSRNEIVEITSIGDFPHLTSLNVAFNQLETISPNAFLKCKGMEFLDLSNNKIGKLVEETFNGLENLLVLNISDNYLRVLKDNVFYNLINLEELQLSGNALHMLRYEHFKEAENLRILNVSRTALTDMDSYVFRTLIHLECLDISSNAFEKVPVKALASAEKLKHLKMNRNKIKELSEDDFKKMALLETLEISDSDTLVAIKKGAFSGLKQLKVLRVTSNPNLQELDFGAFEGLYSSAYMNWTLKELYLRQNGLKTIDNPSKALCNIYIVDLQQNPWNCDCNMLWIPHCTLRIELTSDFKCATPPESHNKEVTRLKTDDLVCPLTPVDHKKRLVNALAITCGVVAIILSVVALAVLCKRQKLKEWWYNRKRGPGAVYYVRADSNPKELLQA